ncbi:hypothetical protein [Candidatus Cyanaurora vandensis]|uniref:hypothetical protein n=1 Tax=Candidatus Cyanaurora vandensis TaxID=2714958 RepID=UPI00257E477F|nr:hypothetical protein [Candidatus Cyanaurora vandensis]
MFKRIALALTVLVGLPLTVDALPESVGEAGVARQIATIDPLKLPYEPPQWRGIKILKPLSRDLWDRIKRSDYFEEIPEANVIDRATPEGELLRREPLVPAVLQLGFNSVEASNLEPPDPHIAVGPSNLMAATNSGLQVHSRTGTKVGALLGLRSFFSVPSNYNLVSDPKVMYDSTSGRFFAVLIGYSNSASKGAWFFAVSTTNSASGTWRTFLVEQTRDLPDYPGWGICNDKVVTTANNFNFSIVSAPFTGSAVVVLNKSQLTSGASTINLTKFNNVLLGNNTQAFTIQPAQSLSSTNTCHMIALRGTTQVQLYRLTGVPTASSNAALATGSAPTVAASSTPVDAAQLGSSRRVDTGDTRLLDATYRNGALWTSHTTGCTFSGTAGTFTCARLLKITGVDATPAVSQDARYGAANFYYSYPALRTDSNDNMGVVFTRVGSSEYTNLRFGGLRAGSSTYESSVAMVTGGASYTGTRWGDYFGAAFDSTDNSLWFLGNYKRSSAFLWSTYAVKTKF